MRWLPRFLRVWGLTSKAMTTTLAALLVSPAVLIGRVEPVNGRQTVRVAVADRMAASCVQCHNQHPDSPKKDWKTGDLRGVLEVDTVIEPQLARHDVMVRNCSLIVGGSAAAI